MALDNSFAPGQLTSDPYLSEREAAFISDGENIDRIGAARSSLRPINVPRLAPSASATTAS